VYLGKGTGKLPKNSKVKADQIRTLDKSRLVKLIGELGIAEIKAIEKALKIHLKLTSTIF
jgi:mRNA interferase MazF